MINILKKNLKDIVVFKNNIIIKEFNFDNEITCYDYINSYLFIGFNNKMLKMFSLNDYKCLWEWKCSKSIVFLWTLENNIYYLDGFGDIYKNNIDLYEKEFELNMNLFSRIVKFIIDDNFLIFFDDYNRIKILDKKNLQNIIMSFTYRKEKILNIFVGKNDLFILFEDNKLGIIEKKGIYKNFENLKLIEFKLEENIIFSIWKDDKFYLVSEIENIIKLYELNLNGEIKNIENLKNDCLFTNNNIFKINDNTLKTII